MNEDIHQEDKDKLIKEDTNVVIGKLTHKDINLIIPLMVAMGRVNNESKAKARIEAIIDNPAYLLAIAKVQGQAVGYVWAQNFGPHLRTGEITARTHDRFVDENFRGRGIGDQLITYTKQWATGLGVKYLQGATNPKGVENLKRLGASFDSQEEFNKHPPFEFQL